jgi:hypothetical protein
VNARLAELPPRQRLVVELRVFHDLSFEEIGAIVDSSEDAAKSNYRHSVNTLREMLSSRRGGTRTRARRRSCRPPRGAPAFRSAPNGRRTCNDGGMANRSEWGRDDTLVSVFHTRAPRAHYADVVPRIVEGARCTALSSFGNDADHGTIRRRNLRQLSMGTKGTLFRNTTVHLPFTDYICIP